MALRQGQGQRWKSNSPCQALEQCCKQPRQGSFGRVAACGKQAQTFNQMKGMADLTSMSARNLSGLRATFLRFWSACSMHKHCVKSKTCPTSHSCLPDRFGLEAGPGSTLEEGLLVKGWTSFWCSKASCGLRGFRAVLKAQARRFRAGLGAQTLTGSLGRRTEWLVRWATNDHLLRRPS